MPARHQNPPRAPSHVKARAEQLRHRRTELEAELRGDKRPELYDELREINGELSELYRDSVAEYETKKDAIMCCLVSFPWLTNDAIAQITGASKGYVSKFTLVRDDGDLVVLDESNKRADDVREQTLHRDGNCVRCSATEERVVHHVIPLALDGPDSTLNTVTLCTECHEAIHGTENDVITYDSLLQFFDFISQSE